MLLHLTSLSGYRCKEKQTCIFSSLFQRAPVGAFEVSSPPSPPSSGEPEHPGEGEAPSWAGGRSISWHGAPSGPAAFPCPLLCHTSITRNHQLVVHTHRKSKSQQTRYQMPILLSPSVLTPLQPSPLSHSEQQWPKQIPAAGYFSQCGPKTLTHTTGTARHNPALCLQKAAVVAAAASLPEQMGDVALWLLTHGTLSLLPNAHLFGNSAACWEDVFIFSVSSTWHHYFLTPMFALQCWILYICVSIIKL